MLTNLKSGDGAPQSPAGKNNRWKAGTFWIAGLIAVTIANAHPDLIEQIGQVTSQMDKQGPSGDLFLKRADLFRRHAEFDAALADLSAAERWKTNLPLLRLARAQVYCDAGRAEAALQEVEDYLRFAPRDCDGMLIRARSRARLGQIEAALRDYDIVIGNSPAPGPNIYLERSHLLAQLGRLLEAAVSLDSAISNSPAASPLQLTAIEYDRQRAAFEAALTRVDRLVAAYPVKEPWLTLRAEVLEQAGRTNEARDTFEDVLTAIGKYPAPHRTLDLTQQLEQRARQGFQRCGLITEAQINQQKHEISAIPAP